MGISLSKRQQHHQHQPPPPSLPQLPPPPPPQQPPSSSSVPPSLAPPSNPSFAYGANAPYSAPSQNPYCLIPAPYPPHSNGQFNYGYNYPNRPVIYHSSYHPPYYLPNAWSGYRPPQHVPPPLPAVPYVDHQNAKKIKNDINVHKDTIKLEVDENNKDCHLVSFVFDALVDGRVTGSSEMVRLADAGEIVGQSNTRWLKMLPNKVAFWLRAIAFDVVILTVSICIERLKEISNWCSSVYRLDER